jgi:hypothetical protein
MPSVGFKPSVSEFGVSTYGFDIMTTGDGRYMGLCDVHGLKRG